MRRLTAVALLALFACPHLWAQSANALPKRPSLDATTDTNDADAFYRLGHELIVRDPRLAADAFYWSTRLNPSAGHAFYGRYAALLLVDAQRLRHYVDGDRKTIESPAVKQIDSLRVRAVMLNPFLYRKYDHVIMLRYFEYAMKRRFNAGWQAPPSEIAAAYRRWIVDGGPAMQAWSAYGEGRFAEAIGYYAEALKKDTKEPAYLRAERGHAFYLAGQYDSAVSEIRLAVEALRKKDSKELVRMYSSKAWLEHSVAKIHEKLGDTDSARASYGRALEEDLAFYPAHANLGVLALQDGDTATALNELELAVQLRGDEPMLRLFYGFLLARLDRFAEAEVQLKKAIELEPFYARSYQLLGHVYEAQRRPMEAVAQYEMYLARAAIADPPRKDVAEQLDVLRNLTRGTKP